MPEELLLAEFPPVPTADWEAAIQRDLKGADYEKRLVWRTEEGLSVRPYYREEDLPLVGQALPPVQAVGRQAAAAVIRADEFHESGAHAAQELADALSAGVDRVVADAPPASIEFVFAAGPYYFIEVAKFRAMRLLWDQAVAAFGFSCPMRLAVRTPLRNKSVLDPYTNLLRVTTEALSAAIGGCDSLTVEPFGFDAHLARNVERILRHEAHIDGVEDPAAGSYYIENLTIMLAREAWKLFQQIEAEGGYAKARASGSVDRALAETRRAREKAVSSRRKTLVGVNNYPAPGSLATGQAETPAPPTPTHRLAQAFEELWARTAQLPRRPRVALVNRGDPKMRQARANFCLNFFGCAGFEIFETDGLVDADLIVLCSSDAEYPALAREICPQSTAPVIVAGPPSAEIAGVAGFVNLQSDAIETLTAWQNRLAERMRQ